MSALATYDDSCYSGTGNCLEGEAFQFRKKNRSIPFDGGSFSTRWPIVPWMFHVGLFMSARGEGRIGLPRFLPAVVS